MRGAVVEPVAADLASALRCAVLDHARGEPRRVHPAVLHAGVPRGPVRRFEVVPGELDHTLRVDVVLALLAWARRRLGSGALRDRCGREASPLLWLTRALLDDERAAGVDLPWAAAVDQARAELGPDGPHGGVRFVVVDRRGWRDPRSGVSRHWVKIRPGAADR